jgi:nicotinamidase/pyrazinamidase
MLEGPLVFVDIDTQRDFLEPTGALYVGGGVEILSQLARLSRYAREHDIPVLATACAHRPDDPELERFPPHCMIGSAGQERIDATRPAETLAIGEDDEPTGPLPGHVTIQKREIDFFTSSHADFIIRQLDVRRPTFVVYGVATDYCVAAAVEGLLARKCRVALVVDAIRAIDRDAEADRLTDFTRRGVLLTLTDVVCGEIPDVHASTGNAAT